MQRKESAPFWLEHDSLVPAVALARVVRVHSNLPPPAIARRRLYEFAPHHRLETAWCLRASYYDDILIVVVARAYEIVQFVEKNILRLFQYSRATR